MGTCRSVDLLVECIAFAWVCWQVVATVMRSPPPDVLSLYVRGDQFCCHVVMIAVWLLQIFFQFKFFLPDPIANDVKYQAAAQPFLVFGLLTTALAIGSTNAI